MDIRHIIVMVSLVLIVGCNTSSQHSALCLEAKTLTKVQRDEQLVNRRLIWHTTISDVVTTNEGNYLVFINDDTIQVNNVPPQIASELNKDDPFNFVGTIKKMSEFCTGEVDFNEPNQ